MLNIQSFNNNISWIHSIPPECLDNILSYFDYKLLLTFESLSKSFSQECQSLIDYHWQRLCIQDGFNFGWKAFQKKNVRETNEESRKESVSHEKYCLASLVILTCQKIYQKFYPKKEIQKENIKDDQQEQIDYKRTYLLSLAILTYQKKYWHYLDEIDFKRFDGMRQSSPFFDFFIREDLNKKLQESTERQRKEIQQAIEEGWAGEQFMMGLIELNKSRWRSSHSLNVARELLTKALENGATRIHSFLYAMGYSERKQTFNVRLMELYKDFVLLSKEKVDKEVKFLIKQNWGIDHIDEKFVRKISLEILVELENELDINHSGKWNLLDLRYRDILTSDPDNIPAYILGCAACVKLKLFQRGKDVLEKAEALYERAIIAYGDNIPTRILENTAFIKGTLKKWNEMELLNEKIFARHLSFSFLSDVLFFKFQQKQWEKAETIFQQIMDTYQNQEIAYQARPNGIIPIAEVLGHGASVKSYLGKFDEAEKLYEKSFLIHGDKVPFWELANASRTKLYLEKFLEAESLCACALDRLKKQRSISIYAIFIHPFSDAELLHLFATIKNRLGKDDEVEFLLKKAIDIYGNNTPSELLLDFLNVKQRLGKLEEAKSH